MKNVPRHPWSATFFTVLFLAAAYPWAVGAHQGKGEPHHAVPKYSFTIEIDGVMVGRVMEISGLKMEIEVIEVKDGTSTEIRKLPGRTIWPEVVLTRLFTGNTVLYDWAVASRTGAVMKRSVVISMLDQRGQPVARYHLENAWPAKWAGPVLNATGTEVAIESVALAHEGLTMSTEPR